MKRPGIGFLGHRLVLLPALSIALAAGAIGWSADASAQGRKERVTVFALQGDAGEQPPGLSPRLTRAIVDHARARGLKVSETPTMFADAALLLGCDPESNACQRQILEQLDSSMAIHGTVAPGDRPGTAVVTVTVVANDQPASTHRFTVNTGTPDQAAAEMDGSLPTLFGDSAVTEPVPAGSPAVDGGGSALAFDRTSWVLVGTGGAVTGVGMIFWIAASSKQSDIDDAPTDNIDDLERLEDLESDAKLRANVGNVLVAAGVITIGVGVVRAVLQQRDQSSGEQAPGPAAPTASRARDRDLLDTARDVAIDVAPISSDGGFGVTFTWTH